MWLDSYAAPFQKPMSRRLEASTGCPFWSEPPSAATSASANQSRAVVGARYDVARFGMESFRASPRQADLMIVPGRVSHKMARPLRQIYDQMLEPKWVIAMGACASSGGMFNNYATLQCVDRIVAVDLYIPGCPPRPEALLEGSCACMRRFARASRRPTRSAMPPSFGDPDEEPRLATRGGRLGPRQPHAGARTGAPSEKCLQPGMFLTIFKTGKPAQPAG